MPPKYVVEPLMPQHDRTAFSCGVEILDRYLREQAGQERRRDVAAVYILRLLDTDRIGGYFTLSATSIEPLNLPTALTKRMPRYPTLPALLIGRLAVDQHLQGQGIGRALLMSALTRCLDLRSQLGAIGVIVDAKDAAAQAFYERYDFHRFVDDPYRLILAMKTIEQLATG